MPWKIAVVRPAARKMVLRFVCETSEHLVSARILERVAVGERKQGRRIEEGLPLEFSRGVE